MKGNDIKNVMICSTFLFIVQFLFFFLSLQKGRMEKKQELAENHHLNMLGLCCTVAGRQQGEKLKRQINTGTR